MNRRFSRYLPSLLIAIAVPVSVPAQAEGWTTNIQLPPVLGRVEHPRLSDDAEWALLVHQSGGFSGRTQTVTIDSTGRLGCSGFQASCRAEIEPNTLTLLDMEIENAVPEAWSSTLVPCSDCVTRMVILVLKNAEEQSVEHIAYWNVVTPETSIDAGRLHQMIRDLRFPE